MRIRNKICCWLMLTLYLAGIAPSYCYIKSNWTQRYARGPYALKYTQGQRVFIVALAAVWPVAVPIDWCANNIDLDLSQEAEW